jgi:hypothetical protein
MSNQDSFTHVGVEASKIISRILVKNMRDSHKIEKYTKKANGKCNDNIRPNDLAKGQLNLFDYAVGE